MTTGLIAYPAGARLRVADICGNPKTGKRGLLPITHTTWYKWVKAGKVPPGQKICGRTTVWPIEVVLALGQPNA